MPPAGWMAGLPAGAGGNRLRPHQAEHQEGAADEPLGVQLEPRDVGRTGAISIDFRLFPTVLPLIFGSMFGAQSCHETTLCLSALLSPVMIANMMISCVFPVCWVGGVITSRAVLSPQFQAREFYP